MGRVGFLASALGHRHSGSEAGVPFMPVGMGCSWMSVVRPRPQSAGPDATIMLIVALRDAARHLLT